MIILFTLAGVCGYIGLKLIKLLIIIIIITSFYNHTKENNDTSNGIMSQDYFHHRLDKKNKINK